MTLAYKLARNRARVLMVGGTLIDAAAREAAADYPGVDAEALAADLLEEQAQAARTNAATTGVQSEVRLRRDVEAYWLRREKTTGEEPWAA